jgi:RND family efflux transporter MFP subunit
MQGLEPDRRHKGHTVRVIGLVLVGAVVLGGAAFWGINDRATAMTELTRETSEMAVPTVAVVSPKPGAPTEEIVLPGTMQAFSDAPIYARTSGYLKRRLVEMGTRVKTNQLLAEIDAPELEQQLQQSRADLATAEANAKLAQITADRYLNLRKTDSVSQQDADNASGGLDARKTAVVSALHNVQRLEQMQAYTKIYAPFDGVITARNTDVGALIDSGASGGTARELFHIASTDKLRVFVNVPEIYSRAATPGLTAELALAEFPGKSVMGKLVRTAQAIDVASRTLLVEVEVANPSGELLAGSYAEVHLKLPTARSTFRLPVNALMFRSDGLRLAIVKPGGKIAMVPVMLGRDFGTEVEIISGVTGQEKVVINPPDALVDGQVVNLAKAAPAAPQKGSS